MSTPITLTGAYTCTHHNDKQRAECPVCLVAKLRAEVERLRSDRDCEKRLRKDADEFRENAIERATKAEADAERYRLVTLRQDAELAAERARLDWLDMTSTAILLAPKDRRLNVNSTDVRAAIDAAMKEETK